jgi:cytochrome c peroxidase
LLYLLNSCHNDKLTQIPYQPHYLAAPQPPGFPPMRIPADNPLTEAGVALGRKLFFDSILSRDSSIACSTCHQPHLAFADGNPFSKGILGRKGKRSTLSLLNVGFYAKGLFWDGRATTLEEQSLHPVRDSTEMDHSWVEVAQKLQAHPLYPSLFRQAFGITRRTAIDSVLVGKALAQYERTLISADTRFDQVMRGEAQFSAQEKRGWTIFFDASALIPTSECNHCHVDPLFSTLAFENNGLDPALSLDNYVDKGRGAVTGNRNNNGQFRVPTLRNLKYTAPYMHDGRFKTLEEVLSHYTSGGHPGINVSPNVRQLNLSQQDRAALIAFLNTLNDEK